MDSDAFWAPLPSELHEQKYQNYALHRSGFCQVRTITSQILVITISYFYHLNILSITDCSMTYDRVNDIHFNFQPANPCQINDNSIPASRNQVWTASLIGDHRFAYLTLARYWISSLIVSERKEVLMVEELALGTLEFLAFILIEILILWKP